ncbi:MAG TPA: hypothetical protein VJ810_32925 [Blastocatellia bacterium]|nr:hypothetical protein [Blastocatellia bacterium]
MSEQICVSFSNEYRSQQDFTPALPSSSKNVAVKRSSASLPKYGKATHPSVTNLLNTSAGYTIKTVIAELEKRRAQSFALACAAEARAQEAEKRREQAEKKLEQAENRLEQAEDRLEQEMNQRLTAERRLKEFEGDRHRQLQALEFERVKTLEAVLSYGEAEARLKKAEVRIKEAENDATSLTIALARAYKKRTEAEATARAIEEKAQIIEALFLRSEDGPRKALEGHLVFGLLIFASRNRMKEMERAIRNVDAKHRLQEDYVNNLLQKQTAKLRPIPEKANSAESEFTSFNLLKSASDDHSCHVTVQKGLGTRLKLIIYGMLFSLLVAVCWGLITAFLQT